MFWRLSRFWPEWSLASGHLLLGLEAHKLSSRQVISVSGSQIIFTQKFHFKTREQTRSKFHTLKGPCWKPFWEFWLTKMLVQQHQQHKNPGQKLWDYETFKTHKSRACEENLEAETDSLKPPTGWRLIRNDILPWWSMVVLSSELLKNETMRRTSCMHNTCIYIIYRRCLN